MKSKIYNIFTERKIPSWKATEEIPEILVISADPPSTCPYQFYQTWQLNTDTFTWDTYPISATWDSYSDLVCPTIPDTIPFWCSDTYSRDGGIISETVVIGTIFDDQE